MKKKDSSLNVVSEIELSYLPKLKPSALRKISGQEDAYKVFIKTWDKSKINLCEQLKVMLLNRANRILGICTLTSGTVSGTLVDPKQVFSVALKANASKIILAHNHPSGNLVPSRGDFDMTQKIKAGSDILDLKFLDHMIVTTEGFYSFASEGVI